MIEEKKTSEMLAKLNEAVDVLAALKSGELSQIIGRGGNPRAGCDYNCDCNQSMCGCRGSVKSSDMDMISFPEFMAIREARLAELKHQIEALEVPMLKK